MINCISIENKGKEYLNYEKKQTYFRSSIGIVRKYIVNRMYE